MPKNCWTHIIIEAFCLLKHEVRTFKPLYEIETKGDEVEFVEIPDSKRWLGYSFVEDDEYRAAVEAMMNLPETDT